MKKDSDYKKVLIILKAILMSKDYQNCYKKYIDTKHKAHNKKDMSNHMAWYEIARRWSLSEPLDPSIDVSRISRNRLSLILLGWQISGGAVTLKWDEHLQLKGKEKVQTQIPVYIDITYKQTRIVRDLKQLIKKLQENRKAQQGDVDDVPKGKERVIYYNLGDFDNYKLCNKYRKGSRIPFHIIAKDTSSIKNADPESIDSYAKFLRDSYKRADWLIKGGYKVLMKKL